jgi:hypothetical protein
MRMQILIMLGFRHIALKNNDKRINGIIYRQALTSPRPKHFFFLQTY